MKKLFQVAAFAMGAAAGIAEAGLDNYSLRRLPAALGNEFSNANGDTRQFIPTSISDSGLLAGTRLTWTPDGNGGIADLKGQASYIYDLNTRTYVADNIRLMAITHITNDNYVAKRLHPAGTRWQTYRCPISGLVQITTSAGALVWDNPSCVLIDNDALDAGIPQTDFQGAFLYVNGVYRPGEEWRGSNEQGSTIVANYPDDFDSELPQPVYYRANGTVQTYTGTDDVVLTGIFQRQTHPDNFILQTVRGADDVLVAHYPTDGTAPAEIVKAVFSGTSTVPTIETYPVDWQAPGGGEYLDVVSVSPAGDVMTFAGVCQVLAPNDGCVNQTTIDFSTLAAGLGADASAAEPQILNNEIILVRSCDQQSDPQCSGSVYLFDISTQLLEKLDNLVLGKFGEQLNPIATTYSFPKFGAVAAVSPIPGRILSSKNGRYLVWVSRDSGGVLRRYSVVFN